MPDKHMSVEHAHVIQSHTSSHHDEEKKGNSTYYSERNNVF